MLQRAASNAYSWWWASHVRTKQSKWLEQNLQDMEGKVKDVVKLIEEDGDSFAKRAEMYYKKRPEIINFVEESYRAYRALAERYDHISTELQNANTTIASVFPEQVQLAMDEDDEASPKVQKKTSEVPDSIIPKVPNGPTKDLKGLQESSARKLKPKKATKAERPAGVARSGLSKTEALKEIGNLQKRILALQTEKEFVKVSYESGLTKYWELETQITETQGKICSLQDEYGVGAVVEDDEARTLMASAALKMCQETLDQLQDEQEKSAMEAKVEHQKIKDVREKLKSLKDEFLCNEINQEDPDDKYNPVEAYEKPNSLDQEATAAAQDEKLESLREKIKEHLSAGGSTSLTVTEMAEKVDELVTMIVSLETAISSQTALIRRLQVENDELQAQIGSLENERVIQSDDGANNLGSKIQEMEEKLRRVQDLNRNIGDQNSNLQTHFSEANCNLDQLTEKLHSMKPDEESCFQDSLQEEKSKVAVESQKAIDLDNEHSPHCDLDMQHISYLDQEVGFTNASQQKELSLLERGKKESNVQEDRMNHANDVERIKDLTTEFGEENKAQYVSASITNQGQNINQSQTHNNLQAVDEDKKIYLPYRVDDPPNARPWKSGTDRDEEPNWQQLFLNGLEDREKVLLEEYTSILRNYKEIKKKESEVEKKNQESLLDATVQLTELRSANAMKDVEIRSLRQRLTFLQARLNETMDLKETIDSNYQPTSNLDYQPAELKAKKEEPAASMKESTVLETADSIPTVEEDGNDVKAFLVNQPNNVSSVEEKFRMKIDELLEQNLDFWLRFSTSFHQIQTNQTGIQDLRTELVKLTGKLEEKNEGSRTPGPSLKSDARAIYKHLREIQTELGVWVEHSVLLKDELQSRFSSLCNIQEQLSKGVKESSEEGDKLTGYQAAKFQGEVMNMKQENNKVADELQAGLDHVTGLQLEVERTVAKLNEDFELFGSKHHNHPPFKHSTSRPRVPLRSFLFGARTRTQKPSLFSCVQPALNRKYHHLRAGIPMSLKTSSRNKDL